MSDSSQAVALAAKTELSLTVSELMPQGIPQYRAVMKRTPMFLMLQSDTDKKVRKELHKTLYTLVKEFCNSLNLVRPMDDFQIVDAATYLLDECFDFRIEDFVVMFTMAKRGQLVKIMDRMDIQVIGQIMRAYTRYRDTQIDRIEREEHEKRKRQEWNIPTPQTPEEIAASERFAKIVELLKNADGPDRKPLGERTKEELEQCGMNEEKRQAAYQQMLTRQREKLAQSKYYRSGLPIRWVRHGYSQKTGHIAILCTGKIVKLKGDGMEVSGEDEYGNQVTDHLSIKDTSVEIILNNINNLNNEEEN